jgi:hypothetical protein
MKSQVNKIVQNSIQNRSKKKNEVGHVCREKKEGRSLVKH